MRISLVSSGLAAEFGGAAQSETELVRFLARHLDIQLLCPADRYDRHFAKARGVEGLVRPFRRGELVHLSSKTDLGKGLVAQNGVHLNGHWRWENAFLCRFLRKEKIPYVYHPRGMCWVGHRKLFLKKLFNQMLGKKMVQGAERVICLSRFEVEQLSPYRVKSDRFAVIPNGIEVPSHWTPGAPSRFFLYLGRIERRKNLIALVRAYSQYRSQGGTAGLRLIGPVERGYDQAVLAEVRRLSLGEWVTLEPPIYGDGKWGLMERAVALVYPSRGEPFGRVPFEAVAVGGVPIVPRESGAAEYLAPFFPNLIYSLDDTGDLARCLSSADHLKTHREGAKQFVLDRLDWDRVGAEVLALYGLVFGRGVEGQPGHEGRVSKVQRTVPVGK